MNIMLLNHFYIFTGYPTLPHNLTHPNIMVSAHVNTDILMGLALLYDFLVLIEYYTFAFSISLTGYYPLFAFEGLFISTLTIQTFLHVVAIAIPGYVLTLNTYSINHHFTSSTCTLSLKVLHFVFKFLHPVFMFHNMLSLWISVLVLSFCITSSKIMIPYFPLHCTILF